MDFNSISAYLALPVDRQEEILLQVMYHEGTNFLGPFLNAAGKLWEIVYMVALIKHHHRKVAAGTPLEFAARSQVTPVANRQARFPADAATNNYKRNQRQPGHWDVR